MRKSLLWCLALAVFFPVYGWQLGCKSCQKDTNEFHQPIVQSKSWESIHNPATLLILRTICAGSRWMCFKIVLYSSMFTSVNLLLDCQQPAWSFGLNGQKYLRPTKAPIIVNRSPTIFGNICPTVFGHLCIWHYFNSAIFVMGNICICQTGRREVHVARQAEPNWGHGGRGRRRTGSVVLVGNGDELSTLSSSDKNIFWNLEIIPLSKFEEDSVLWVMVVEVGGEVEDLSTPSYLDQRITENSQLR